MGQLMDLSARALSRGIEAGEITCVELMRATLDRIAVVNGSANAIVSLREEAALIAEAAEADISPRKGWLHGIPMAVKDLVMTKGLRTTLGSPIFANHIPDADDILAARLKADGAIIIGKTNTPEFGLGSNTFNRVHGITVNPYDGSKSCGGSSGGAAVSLATRMTAVADGSDMMGSLRNPAGWCNVYGLRPTIGVVPDEPKADYFLHPLATLGPMARNPEDIAWLLQTLSGPDYRQVDGVDFDASGMNLSPDMTGKRIGWLGDWGGALPYEDGVAALCEEALKVYESLGARVEALAPPHDMDAIWDSWTTLRSWAVASGRQEEWEDPEKRAKIKEDGRWEIERGRAFTGMDIHNASVAASSWYRAAAELFQTYDALVLPSAQVWPFSTDMIWPKEIEGTKMDTYHRWMQVVIPVSLIGLPSVSVPAGFGDNGLPMGMQLFGPRGADLQILELAQAYHLATDWPNNRPPKV